MDFDRFRDYCLVKKGVTEGFPFDETTLVFKVLDKIFALTDIEKKPFEVNLKCEPLHAVELRETYKEVRPGYHMNKKHWNTVNFEGRVPEDELKQMIDDSYELVVKKMTKADRETLGKL
jgi:predicted DNA-binding protein (MmcQ/YjbR family)